jgi:hypothetical protein
LHQQLAGLLLDIRVAGHLIVLLTGKQGDIMKKGGRGLRHLIPGQVIGRIVEEAGLGIGRIFYLR